MLRALRSGAAGAFVAMMLWPTAAGTTGNGRLRALEVPDLTGRLVAPFQASGPRAVVFVFTTIDCPISNRYAPEVQRLHREFGADAAFWLVYPDVSLTPEVLRQHAREFGYSFPALHDTKHALVRLTGATAMSEVAVFDRSGRLVYRGRIDNRVVDFGTIRAEATRRDLQEVLGGLRAGIAMSPGKTRAIGCDIPD